MSRYEKYIVSACEIYNQQSYEKIRQIPIINLCVYGGGRSPEASKILDDMGHQSVFLDCGLAGIRDFYPDYQRIVIERISNFQCIFVFTRELERSNYSNILKQINIPESNYFCNEVEFHRQIKERKVKFS